MNPEPAFTCHFTVGAGVPQAAAVNVTAVAKPASVVALVGLVVTTGAAGVRKHVGRPLVPVGADRACGAPAATVLPLIETERPKSSSAAPSDAVNFVACSWSPNHRSRLVNT